MPETSPIQFSFAGGANANSAEHAIADNEVATATNVDFTYSRGAAMCRRGSLLHWDFPLAGKVKYLYRKYNNAIATSPVYAFVGSTATSTIYRGSGAVGTGTSSWTAIASGLTGDQAGFVSYQGYCFVAPELGTKAFKDDGTTVTDWIKQAPTNAPTITGPAYAASNITTFWTVSEGTISGDVGGTCTSTATGATDASTFRLVFDAVSILTNQSVIGANTVGVYGYDILQISFSNPTKVTRVSQDFSAGDSTYAAYWHTEVIPGESDALQPGPEEYIRTQVSYTPTGDLSRPIGLSERERMIAEAQAAAGVMPAFGYRKDVYNVWLTARPNFYLLPKTTAGVNWSNIQAGRIIVEATDVITVMIKGWQIQGDELYCLSDPQLGYVYWETWATLDSGGNVIGESAPGPPSVRTPIFAGAFTVVNTTPDVPTGGHGITHRLFYRQGGFLPDAYLVGSCTITSSSINDASLPDTVALARNQRLLTRNNYTKTTFPNTFRVASEPFYERIVLGAANQIFWSLPAIPDAFSPNNQANVSHEGDEVQGLIVWPPGMVIVNRDSVYEWHGSVFEGDQQDWSLTRTGSKRGNLAWRTIIKTPYGIPLLDRDGLYMYVPGQGVDVPVDWITDRIGDAWQGAGDYDLPALKGNRVPAINKAYLQDSCAAFQNNRLYLGMPTGTNTSPSTLFVCDFANKQVQWYTYPWTFTSLFWDNVTQMMYATTTTGEAMQIETLLQDQTIAGVNTGVVWRFRTRQWSAPSDTILENISAESIGNGTLYGLYDGTTTATIGTLTSTVKDWSIPKLGGTVCNNVAFEVAGTQTSGVMAGVYGITFDAIVHPKRVTYWRTEEEVNGYDGDKLWDVHYADLDVIGTGHVHGTSYIDNIAVMTFTVTGPTSGRFVTPTSFPLETYGVVAYTVYNADAGIVFKHWKTTYQSRNEPPWVTSWKSDIQSLEENICDAFDVDINPLTTATSVCYVDNTAVSTHTHTGAKRQSYTCAIPRETYGRTLYVTHAGTRLKHYNTWFHLRLEPDRWTSFVSDRVNGNEKRWNIFGAIINPLSGTTTATVVLDGTAINTHTMTGSVCQSFVFALGTGATEYYGRTIYASYSCSGTDKLKHYKTWFEGVDEPDRVTTCQTEHYTFPSEQDPSTWIVDINPLGAATGVLYADGVAVNTATFTGTIRKVYNEGLDISNSMVAATSATKWQAIYTAVGTKAVLKHYNTKFETTSRPFGKKTWMINYKKIGGASQLDFARFWSIDIEAEGTATMTSVWDVDGVEAVFNILTITNREWRDRIPFPPGARGYLFQQRLYSPQGVHVWASNLDTIRTGIKGLARAGVQGTPHE